jgi:hypothetical protein
MIKGVLAIFVLALSVSSLANADISVSGGTYTPEVIGGVPGFCNTSALDNGTILQVANATGGNDGFGSTCYGLGIVNGFSTAQALSGSFQMQLDTVQGACPSPAPGQPGCFPFGQSIYLLVIQPSGDPNSPLIFHDLVGFAPSEATLTTLTFNGTFDPSNFVDFSILGPAHPDFSGGTQTEFGFAASNTNLPTVWGAYENFRLTADATPEPNFYGLVALGLGGIVFVRRWNKSKEER